MGIYIAGTLNRFAPLPKNFENPYEKFEESKQLFEELAGPLNLFVSLDDFDDGQESALVIHNTKPDYKHLYANEMFTGILEINDDSTFEQRSNKLIELIRSDECLAAYKLMPFSEVGKRYFTIS